MNFFGKNERIICEGIKDLMRQPSTDLPLSEEEHEKTRVIEFDANHLQEYYNGLILIIGGTLELNKPLGFEEISSINTHSPNQIFCSLFRKFSAGSEKRAVKLLESEYEGPDDFEVIPRKSFTKAKLIRKRP